MRPLLEDLDRFVATLQTASEAEKRAKLDKLQFSLLDTLPDTMNTLLKGLKADFVMVEDLPRDLAERWLSKDGIYRIMITPSRNLNDNKNLKDFVTEVRQAAPDATDLPVIYLESGNTIVGAFQQALVSALVAIILVLLLSQRNIKDVLLILLPLLMDRFPDRRLYGGDGQSVQFRQYHRHTITFWPGRRCRHLYCGSPAQSRSGRQRIEHQYGKRRGLRRNDHALQPGQYGLYPVSGAGEHGAIAGYRLDFDGCLHLGRIAGVCLYRTRR